MPTQKRKQLKGRLKVKRKKKKKRRKKLYLRARRDSLKQRESYFLISCKEDKERAGPTWKLKISISSSKRLKSTWKSTMPKWDRSKP